MANFKIDKDEEDIWGVYQVTVGARIFAGRDDTDFIALDTTSFEIDLVKPVFEEVDYTDEDYNWDDEEFVEKIWNPVTYITGDGSVTETDADGTTIDHEY